MKKLFLMIVGALGSLAAFSQMDIADGITVCHTSSTDKFALLASNKEFSRQHLKPQPYLYVSEVGKMVTFKTPDGKDASGFVIMAAKKTNNWIFVFQEWWGLNDHIKREAEKLYNDMGNVNVLALDMYDGKVATEPADAGKYMGEFKADRGTAIFKGALDFAGKSAKIGTIGWCFGGGLSLQASLTAGKQAVATVMYYGMPEEDVTKLKTLNSDVLNIWPTQDKWINKEVMDKFEANMKAAGKKLTVKAYDADHAFANPSNPKFKEEFTADAYKNTLDFFKARLK